MVMVLPTVLEVVIPGLTVDLHGERFHLVLQTFRDDSFSSACLDKANFLPNLEALVGGWPQSLFPSWPLTYVSPD